MIALSLALSACGGDDGSAAQDAGTAATAATEGNPDDVQVIRDWSEALSDGDIDTAAGFFAVPSVAENGALLKIEDESDAKLFNESLPCGAELQSTEAEGAFITATFVLKDRPGVTTCPGDGATAQTSFVIENGLIKEWRRVGAGAAPPGGDDGGSDSRQTT